MFCAVDKPAPSCKHCWRYGVRNNSCGQECYFDQDDGECKEKGNSFMF